MEKGKCGEGCWFGLSNPNSDIELVASIGLCHAFFVILKFSL